jgi:hypothetical protein
MAMMKLSRTSSVSTRVGRFAFKTSTTGATTRSATTATTGQFLPNLHRCGLLHHCQQEQTVKYNVLSRSLVARPRPRPFSSSTGSNNSSKPDIETTAESSPFVANLALAAVLFGFVGFVFTYSMNAVGKSDGDDDPLAQLKAEAQEARDSTSNPTLTQRKMTPEEIMALESGMGSKPDSADVFGDGQYVEVAVAAPADIAALEEEANLKVFRQKQMQQQGTTSSVAASETPAKKKPWWRFGF